MSITMFPGPATSVQTQLLSTLQVELSNIEDIYNSGKTTIISAINNYNLTSLLMDNYSHILTSGGAYYPS